MKEAKTKDVPALTTLAPAELKQVVGGATRARSRRGRGSGRHAN
jgi:hypothetical protein